jgi:hypothetical protein
MRFRVLVEIAAAFYLRKSCNAQVKEALIERVRNLFTIRTRDLWGKKIVSRPPRLGCTTYFSVHSQSQNNGKIHVNFANHAAGSYQLHPLPILVERDQ